MKPPVDSRLARQREIWEKRPLLREVYYDLYARITRWLSEVPGPTIEVGGGSGNLKEYLPSALSSDVTWCPWLDFVADAACLPHADASIANLVFVDVFHHLPFPLRVLAEVQRVLRPGGRAILCEPYVSWGSWPVYRFLHPERTDCGIRPLEGPPDHPVFPPAGPWSSNQAIPTVIFRRDRANYTARFPKLPIRHWEALSVLVYPLSGGFEKPCLLPRFAWPLAWRVERLVSPLARWVGFRCLVVLERLGDDGAAPTPSRPSGATGRRC